MQFSTNSVFSIYQCLLLHRFYVFTLRSMQILTKKIKKISVFLAKKKRFCESKILISKYFFHAVVVQYPPRMKLHGLWFIGSLNCLGIFWVKVRPNYKICALNIPNTFLNSLHKDRTKSNLVKKVTFIELSVPFLSVFQGILFHKTRYRVSQINVCQFKWL